MALLVEAQRYKPGGWGVRFPMVSSELFMDVITVMCLNLLEPSGPVQGLLYLYVCVCVCAQNLFDEFLRLTSRDQAQRQRVKQVLYFPCI